ncbi:MAG: aminotransferase class IV [Myxococcota bacterium]|nr:aminotransferase class IV [Myxococcota bacterium]
MSKSTIWVNGREGGQVPGDDPGLLFGLTAFETLRTYDGVPFRFDAHLLRLQRSADAMGLDLPPIVQVRREIRSACQGNVSIRYTVTAGGNIILQRKAIESGTAGRVVRVASLSWVNPPSLPGAVKHGCRAAWLLAARKAQVDEVLLVDPDGHILEANRSNVFAVIEGRLITPPLDGRQLAGVTREALMDAAKAAQIDVAEAAIPVDSSFDELYLASTLKELSPVVECNGRPLTGHGPIGARLHRAFRRLVHAECGS